MPGGSSGDEWSDREESLWNSMMLPEEADRWDLRIAFDYYLFTPDETYRTHTTFRDYLTSELAVYGIDFEAVFDWREYKDGGGSEE